MLIFIYLQLKESPMTLRQEIDHASKVVQTASQHMLDLDMYSSNAILVNLDENQIVLDKKSEEKIYPASLTKMMTVLVAIEQISNLQEEIIFYFFG